MLIWYLARGAGIAAFAMLSVATAVGAVSARRTAAADRRVVLQYLHRAAALVGVLTLVLHVVTVLADSYAHVGLAGALVPFASGYRPHAITFGVLSLYLLLVVTATGLLRSSFLRSDKAVRRWRAIHLASYAGWAASALHFYTAGSDAGQGWARLVLIAGIGVVAASGAWRWAGPTHRPDRPAGQLAIGAQT